MARRLTCYLFAWWYIVWSGLGNSPELAGPFADRPLCVVVLNAEADGAAVSQCFEADRTLQDVVYLGAPSLWRKHFYRDGTPVYFIGRGR